MTFATDGFSFSFAQDSCPCYTHSITTQHRRCSTIRGCIRPACLLLKTTTIPGPNDACSATPTATVTTPCVTTCNRGCGIAVSMQVLLMGTIADELKVDHRHSIQLVPAAFISNIKSNVDSANHYRSNSRHLDYSTSQQLLYVDIDTSSATLS